MTDREIQAFIDHLEHERRYSVHTIKAYKADLEDYKAHIRHTYGELKLHDHNTAIIRSWLSKLLAEGHKARTVSRKISSLKSFFKYCLHKGFLKTNPTLKLPAVKIPQRLPVFVQESDMQRLFTDIEFEDNYAGVRDYTLLNLLYGSGIRVSELVNLTVDDINSHDSSLKVLGKRNKERIIPVNRQLNEILSVYLKYRKEFKQEHRINIQKDWLFLSGRGNKTYPKLIYAIVKSYLEQVTTIDKKSPHVIRHTYATHLLSHGADLNAIKELLGHSNLAATQVYTHSTIDQLKAIYEQAHPKGK